VDRVLHLVSQHQRFLKQSKCDFGGSEVEYLGHLVGKDGVKVDLRKIEAMQHWPHPKTLKILCGFWGLTGYYRKFVKNYGNIATPLTPFSFIVPVITLNCTTHDYLASGQLISLLCQNSVEQLFENPLM
jgi:hypothetical protein